MWGCLGGEETAKRIGVGAPGRRSTLGRGRQLTRESFGPTWSKKICPEIKLYQHRSLNSEVWGQIIDEQQQQRKAPIFRTKQFTAQKLQYPLKINK